MVITSLLLGEKSLYLNSLPIGNLWSMPVCTCSWEETALQGEALFANSSSSKTFWWKNWKLALKHSQSEQLLQRVAEPAHLLHRKWLLCISQLLSWQRSLRPWERAGMAGAGWCLFSNLWWPGQSFIKLSTIVGYIHLYFARDKEWCIKLLKQGRVKNGRIFLSHSISKTFINPACLACSPIHHPLIRFINLLLLLDK